MWKSRHNAAMTRNLEISGGAQNGTIRSFLLKVTIEEFLTYGN
jgi:hypothetical protein